MMKLPDTYHKDLSSEEYLFLTKMQNDFFKKQFILSVYADLEGYSMLVMGRDVMENNTNYIIYSSHHLGKKYTPNLIEELNYLKNYFKTFSEVYCIDNPALNLYIKSVSYKPILMDFKQDDIEKYLLVTELLIGGNKLLVNPIVKGFSEAYESFNISIKSYPIYALMLPFIDYNESSSVWAWMLK